MSEHDLEAVAEALAPKLRQRADEIEAARRLPFDVSRMLAEAGCYRMFVPARIGGLEVSPLVGSRVFETLARADASSAWVAFIGATSGTVLAHIPEAAAREIFATAETLVCGVFAPSGTATRVDGGFRVSGRWQWGSGCENADWLLGGCTLFENGQPALDASGAPRQHMVLFPEHEVEFLDTWHVSGLRGTGSCDFRVDDIFVPDSRVVGLAADATADTALFRFPHFTLLALGIAAITLGLARSAIDELVRLAVGKKRFGSGSPISAKVHSQLELAAAEARLRSARAFYYETLEAAWAAAGRGESIPLELRRDLRLATTHTVSECTKVVDAMYTLAGGASVYESSRLQRQFRDVHVATQHIMVGPGTLETVGRLLFGLESNTSTL
jgi:alkylation response protein AidB-like acyl-CoA dehydrogenase